jgi:hypothetical protein
LQKSDGEEEEEEDEDDEEEETKILGVKGITME